MTLNNLIDGNKGVLRIPQSSSIIAAWLSDYLVSYPGHLFGVWESYPSAEMQSVYSAAPTDKAMLRIGTGSDNGFKYSYLILTIFEKIYFIFKLEPNR